MPEASLIFVNYQSARLLSRALESLFLLEDERTFEVVVVNNDERETEALRALQTHYPFRLATGHGNPGFGPACNKGARLARGSFLGFLNPDIVWKERTLPALLRASGERALFGLRLLTEGGMPQEYDHGREVTLFRLLQNHFVSKRPPLGSPDWVSGCALFLRKDLFEELAGFDESFFLYYEDIDLCRRAKEKGITVSYRSDLPLIHLGGKSQPSLQAQKREYFRSQCRYFQKHRPYGERLLLPLFQKLASLRS